jgi:hypothetical protein
MVTRSAAGTDDELVKAVYVPIGRWLSRSEYGLLADAIREVAPVADRKQHTPEQRYATAHEAEFLWRAGRHEDAVASVDARPSDVPVENRELWMTWVSRVSHELGPTHPLTLVCLARLATWTGKAGEPAAALAQLQNLLPRAESALAAAEILSIRNNIAYQLMELKRHEEARTEFAALVIDTTNALGPDNPETLHARQQFAVATGKCGEGDESLRLSRDLLPDAERVLGVDDDLVGQIQHSIVFWTAHREGHPPPEFSSSIEDFSTGRGGN